MDIGSSILSDFIIFDKYARHLDSENRRETFEEIVDRNKEMHLEKFPELEQDIEWAYSFVYQKKLLPSMRSMQFAGRPIKKNPARCYNCCYLPLDSIASFSESMFLLLCGCGVGYSVKRIDTYKLPEFKDHIGGTPFGYTFTIPDSIEGWADAVKELLSCYLGETAFNGDIVFDYSEIRPKGSRLSSGGVAPGPVELSKSLESARSVLLRSRETNKKLKPIDCHDIVCHLSNAVLSGGIRRSAMIALFDMDDIEMVTCKFPENIKDNPQRYRANNSGVFMRGKVTKEEFDRYWTLVEASKAGEPGIFWTDSWEMGGNPCLEISLNPFQLCNLVEINFSSVENQEDFNDRCKAAGIISTLQASYTDFVYLRPIWREVTEKEALIGVSMTGIANAKTNIIDFEKGAEIVKDTNLKIAKRIKINPSARCTTIKPAGTTSIVLACSSGIHAWHDKFYLRRVRLNKTDALTKYLETQLPSFLEPSKEKGKENIEIVLSIPIRSSKDAITRLDEASLDLLRRIKYFYSTWIKGGHRYGANTNNVSTTVNIKEGDWASVGEWLWNNQDCYTGISCFPFYNANYEQAPFESIDEATYNTLATKLREQAKDLDFKHVVETYAVLDRRQEWACSGGGSCELV